VGKLPSCSRVRLRTLPPANEGHGRGTVLELRRSPDCLGMAGAAMRRGLFRGMGETGSRGLLKLRDLTCSVFRFSLPGVLELGNPGDATYFFVQSEQPARHSVSQRLKSPSLGLSFLDRIAIDCNQPIIAILLAALHLLGFQHR